MQFESLLLWFEKGPKGFQSDNWPSGKEACPLRAKQKN